MAWSESEFRERVLARAKALGRPWPDVARAAKVDPSTLYRAGQSGRLINKVEDIARALDWSLCDILGCGVLSERALSRAVIAVSRSRSGLTLDRAPLVVRAYEVICAREREGKSVDQSYLDGLSDQMG